MNDGMSDEDLALLTDEEREGLESEEETGTDDAEGEDGDGTDDADEGDEGDADEGGDAIEAPAKVEKADDVPEGDDVADEEDDDTPVTPKVAERVDEAEVTTKLADITTRRTALEEQLDDGEITTKEFAAELDKLNDEKYKLTNTLARQQEQDEAVNTAWYKDVGKFLDKHPELKANDTRLQSFDAVVRRVTGDPESTGLSNQKQLAKARDIWREEMGITETTVEATAKPKPGEKAKAKQAAKPALPPTLHNVPAAEVNDADDGKFSYLDGLMNSGKNIEFEDALAKLSEADQQDYLSRA